MDDPSRASSGRDWAYKIAEKWVGPESNQSPLDAAKTRKQKEQLAALILKTAREEGTEAFAAYSDGELLAVRLHKNSLRETLTVRPVLVLPLEK